MSEQRIAEIRKDLAQGCALTLKQALYLLAAYDALSASPAETGQLVPERPTQSVGTLNSVHPQVTPPAETGPKCATCDGLGQVIRSEGSSNTLTRCPECWSLAPAETGRASETIGWRPIDSAPKDGSWFLAWDYDGGFYVFRDGPGFIASENPQPTHWMPLPAHPPSASSATTEQT